MKKIAKDKIKTWFVTGASSGIGEEMCRQLLAKGYNVIALSRRELNYSHENMLWCKCDVTNEDDIKNAIKLGIQRFGKIDVLANNAGVSSYGTIEEETPEKMKQVMEVNFWGSYNTIRALMPHFRSNKNGTIVNNTSECGLVPRSYGSAYCSSKHALEGLTGAVWQETKKFCRVMAVELSFFPGTEIGKGENKGYSEIAEYKKLNWLPLKCKSNKNRKDVAVSHIISVVENEKIPRRLMLGKNILPKIRYEILALIKDYIKSYVKAWSCDDKDNLFYKFLRRL